LIKKLLEIGTTPAENHLILDFFAGSGSTAHATLAINNEDGGNRKFILIQLPEKIDTPEYSTISEITRERVRRVLARIKNSNEDKLALEDKSRLDQGFRAFKLDSSNFKIWQADATLQSSDELAEQLSLYADNVWPDRSNQDRLFELILKSGLPLSSRVELIAVSNQQAFSLVDGAFIICLEAHISKEGLRELFSPSAESQRPIPQMVICLDLAFDGNDALKTNAVLEAQSHGIIFRTI
jgi:adenine-specific DNA-methyltransferase